MYIWPKETTVPGEESASPRTSSISQPQCLYDAVPSCTWVCLQRPKTLTAEIYGCCTQEQAHAAALSAELLGAFSAVQQATFSADSSDSSCAASAPNGTSDGINGTSSNTSVAALSDSSSLSAPEVALQVCGLLFPEGLPLRGSPSPAGPSAPAQHPPTPKAAVSAASSRHALPDAEGEEESDGAAWAIERGMAALLAVAIIVVPYIFARSAHNITYDGNPLSKLLAYRLDIWRARTSPPKAS